MKKNIYSLAILALLLFSCSTDDTVTDKTTDNAEQTDTDNNSSDETNSEDNSSTDNTPEDEPSNNNTDENPPLSNCVVDYTLSSVGITCDTPGYTEVKYVETQLDQKRKLVYTSQPNHSYWVRKSPYTPVDQSREIPLNPTLSNQPTSILQTNNRPKYIFGVALNGVSIAPAPAEPFIFKDANTGESNWDWVFEPTNSMGDGNNSVKLDCNSAHVSEGKEGYHYHGNMYGYAELLYPGISSGTKVPNNAVQMGWAADGYPILYLYGPDANGDLQKWQPSYKLKQGDRPGDGITEPCGTYDGRYTEDYEYVKGAGDLDACNGIQHSVTLNTALGTETFDYYYVVTESFPQISRCFMGTPDVSFD